MKCSVCKSPIVHSTLKKNYLYVNGNYYCLKCAVKCYACGKKLIKGISTIKKIGSHCFCLQCYKQTWYPTCAGCGKKILNGEISQIILKKVICGECIMTRKCGSCGIPIGKNYAPGRQKEGICFTCTKPHQYTPELIREIYHDVRNSVLTGLNLDLPDTVPVKLEKFSVLQEMIDWVTLEAAGLYNPADKSIYIVPYYPLDYFATVLCHETVHAWQDRHWRSQYDMNTREGMARYVEYRYAQIKSYTDEVEGIEWHSVVRPGSHYTIGLNYFLQMANEKGEQAVIRYFLSL